MSDQTFKAETPFPLPEDADAVAELKAKKERQRAAAAGPPTPRPTVWPSALPAAEVTQPKASARPDRAGKVMIAGYFPIATSKALKHIAVDEGQSLQEVMADAFTMYLKAKQTRE